MLNIVVIGGSFTGTKAVELLAKRMHATHRVILIEKNTHFQHLFAFPRFAVVPGHERMAFIPFTKMFDSLPTGSVSLVNARAMQIHSNRVVLDRGDPIPYDFLVLATGTSLASPGSLPSRTKAGGVTHLQKYQENVARSQKIVVIGGGAVGVREYFHALLSSCDLIPALGYLY